MSEVFSKIKNVLYKSWLRIIGVYTPEENEISNKCTCGRSKSGRCEGLHVLTDEQWKSQTETTVKKAKKSRTPRATKVSKIVDSANTSKKTSTKKPRKKTVDKVAKKKPK